MGPHRDDFDIIINGKKAKIYGSQGQQRSAVLSLKLSEAHILKEQTGENPVILLDDVLSELDKKRQDFLLNKITPLPPHRRRSLLSALPTFPLPDRE